MIHSPPALQWISVPCAPGSAGFFTAERLLPVAERGIRVRAVWPPGWTLDPAGTPPDPTKVLGLVAWGGEAAALLQTPAPAVLVGGASLVQAAPSDTTWAEGIWIPPTSRIVVGGWRDPAAVTPPNGFAPIWFSLEFC